MKRTISAALLTAFGAFLILPGVCSFFVTNEIQCDRNDRQPIRCQPGRAGLAERKCSRTPSRAADSACPSQRLTQMPVPGRGVTSVFGWRLHPIFKRRIFHDGVDFAAFAGDRVHCVLDGIVRAAGPSPGYGNTVLVYHPSAQTTSMYAHLSRVTVRAGQSLHQGNVVGVAGSTGLSTGVHLHFGVQSAQGAWINPLAFLKKVASYELVALKGSGSATKSGGGVLRGLASAGLAESRLGPPG